MKKGIILSVFTLFLVLAMGCERDAVLPKLNISISDHLRTLNISGDVDVSISSQVSETRGFPITPNRGNNGKKTATIDFLNGDWDNGSHKPTLLLVTAYADASGFNLTWAKVLEKSEYTYTKADGSNNPKIKFNTDIKYTQSGSTLFVFALDYNIKYTCELNPHGKYTVNFNFPSLRRAPKGTNAYLLKPLAESNIRLIFNSGESIPNIISNKGRISLNMRPFGTLILFDIENVSDKEYTVEDNYQLLIKTAGFSFENVNFSLSNYAANHTPLFDGAGFDKTVYGYKLVDGKAVVDKSNVLSGVSMDYTKIMLEKPKGKDNVILSAKGSGEGSRSAVYGLYVLKNDFEPNRSDTDPRNYGGLSIYHQSAGSGNSLGDLIFDLKNGFDFYWNFYHNTVSMTLSVPSGNGLFDFGEGPDLDAFSRPYGELQDFNAGTNIKTQKDNDPNAPLHDFNDGKVEKDDSPGNPWAPLHDFNEGADEPNNNDSNTIYEGVFEHSEELPNQADPKN